jgi:integrase/recombinase XerD
LENLVYQDPTYKLKYSSKVLLRPKSIPMEEVEAALKAISATSAMEKRDAAIFKTIFYCGLWTEEATKIRYDDFNVKSRLITINNSKGEVRNLKVHDDAFDALCKWVDTHPSKDGALFCSFSNGSPALSQSQIVSAVKKAFAAVGLGGGAYNPRNLRHARGLQLVQENASPVEIARFLGHKSMQSTSRYYQK